MLASPAAPAPTATPPGSSSLTPPSASRRWTQAVLRELGPLLALVVVFAFFAGAEYVMKYSQGKAGSAVFLTSLNLRSIAVNTGSIAVCALGMTVVIIAGGIDLSVGTGLALCATVLAGALKLNVPPAAAVALALLTGCLLGTINGALVGLLRVVPFIITLGTMTIWLGAAKLLAEWVEKGGHTVRPDLKTQVPQYLQTLLSVRPGAVWPGSVGVAPIDAVLDYLRFPVGIWLGLLLAVGLAVVLRYSVFGRYVFALGSNEATARLCGIPVTRTRILVYALGGLFMGIGGVYQFSRLTSGTPTAGSGLELRVIAAVVIGGGSLSGGRGSVLGTLAGAALMSVIASGCTQLSIDNPWQDIILGSIIVAAVTLDQWRQRGTSA